MSSTDWRPTKGHAYLPSWTLGRLVLFSFLVIVVIIAHEASARAEVRPPGLHEVTPHEVTRTSVGFFTTSIDPEGASAEWILEYGEHEGGPWTLVESGVLPELGLQKITINGISGLNPETIYFLKLTAKNEAGSSEAISTFESTPLRPASEVQMGTVTASAAHLRVGVLPHGSETQWHVEYSSSKSGPWTVGQSGVVSAAEAGEEFLHFPADISGLTPGTTYYVRISSLNEPEIESKKVDKQTVSGILGFETAGPPAVVTFPSHALKNEGVRALGVVESHVGPVNELQSVAIEGSPTGGTFTLSFDGEVTEAIPFDVSASGVQQALEELSAIKTLRSNGTIVFVSGSTGGPYTVEFFFGPNATVADEPQIVADGSNLVPTGSATVTTIQNGGPGYDTRYHVEYVTQNEFELTGFSKAASTPSVDLGASARGEEREGVLRFTSQVVGIDMPGLSAGTTYRYRLVATNTSPGDPVATGSEQVLTVPMPASGEEGVCPNQGVRYGASLLLPDCRAYEQVTPAEKKGAMDAFRYGLIFEGAQVGEDGEHFELHVPGVQWGTSPDAGESNYFFTRASAGWEMTSATPQPDAGINRYLPGVFSANLTEIGVTVSWTTSPAVRSPNIEFMVGAPGGPYTAAAVVPRSEVPTSGGWIAASTDGRKLLLEVEDHNLLGHQTGTTSGVDLYEYTDGKLSQVNVLGGRPGTPVSSCGAKVVLGEHTEMAADGSRVFFTDNCTHELYMRLEGMRTTDIGAYELLSANTDGTKLLLEKKNESGPIELFTYETETGVLKSLFTVPTSGGLTAEVSRDISTLYLETRAQLITDVPPPASERADIYSYDISSKAMRFVAETEPGPVQMKVSPEGRYLYMTSRGLGGLPSTVGEDPGVESYRYDSVENDVECITCVSAFNPEPQLGGEIPAQLASDDGNYIFFDTVAPLVKQDVDGEVAPEPIKPGPGEFSEHPSNLYSTSSDVYEWRRNGLDGCDDIEGCLSLITPGRGGFKNVLLGATPSGSNVFVATHEALVAQDDDTAGDVYDVRVDGGYPPPPPRPVECEGDACESPLAAPIDTTPASLSFSGPGNVVQASTTGKAVAKACKKGSVRVRGKCVKSKKKRSKGKTHKRKKAKRARRVVGQGTGRRR